MGIDLGEDPAKEKSSNEMYIAKEKVTREVLCEGLGKRSIDLAFGFLVLHQKKKTTTWEHMIP